MPTRIERSLKKPEPSRELIFDGGREYKFILAGTGLPDSGIILKTPGDNLTLEEATQLKDFLVRWLRQVKAKGE